MKSLVLALVVLFGSVSCYGQERCDKDGYVRFGSPTARWSTNPPRIYGSDGTYFGELSQNRYRPDSISNPYENYGSRYSPNSLNNPYRRYSTQPLYVYPGVR